MEWEFIYVDLWLGSGKTIEAHGMRQVEIARLGTEGWEPVGEVTFQFSERPLEPPVRVSQLMFKRPISN